MTADQYGKLVANIGTRAQAAEMLGVDITTIFRRIAGTMPITKEAALAISSAGRAAGAGVRAKRSDSKRKKSNDESSDLRTVSVRVSEQREPQVRCDDWLAEPPTTPARESQKEPGGERAEFPKPTN